MKQKVLFFILLLIFIIILFIFLYFIGFINVFESPILEKLSIFNFSYLNKISPIFIIIYFIVVSIFFILTISIMLRMIISLRNENISLTTMNIDELTIKNQENENISTTFDKLVDSLNKNINAIKSYTEIIDSDINKIDKANLEVGLQETIDNIYQDFSNMINDIIQALTVSELFEKILYWSIYFSKSKRGSFMVVDKNKELYIYKTVGWEESDKINIQNIRIPLGSGIAGKVASENKRIFVTNIENNLEYDFKYKDKYKTKSFISMPIMGINQVVAVLNLTESKNGLYTINDLEILNLITKLSSKIFELIQIKKRILKG